MIGSIRPRCIAPATLIIDLKASTRWMEMSTADVDRHTLSARAARRPIASSASCSSVRSAAGT